MQKHEYFNSGAEYFNQTRPQRMCDAKQSTGYRMKSTLDKQGSKEIKEYQYHFLKSSADSLDEFGLGVSLYFKTLKAFGVIFLVCGLIGIVAMNENYEYQENYSGLLTPPDPDCDRASADHEDNNGKFEPPHVDTPTRLLGSVYGVTRAELDFSSQGVADIILVAFLFCMVLISAHFEKREVIRSDTNQQTMRDYTVMVVNPPADVTDTQTYYDHFKKFGEVVLISIIPKNGSLLKKIAAKVVKEKQLQVLVDTNDGENSAAPEWVKRLILSVRGKGPLQALFPTQEGLQADIAALGEEIKADTDSTVYPPWRVFVSFNTEAECENCFINNESNVFANGRLVIKEAPEPSEFIYENSDVDNMKAFCHNLLSYLLTFCIAILSYIIIFYLHMAGSSILVTVIIVLINAALPFIMKHLTFLVEVHHNREVIQQSIMVKLLLSRCIVSAVIIYHVTPYEEKFSIASLEAIQDIVLADAIVPLFRAIDVYGYFSRYILAPVLGQDQDSFNLFWRGTEYNLAERYANALKTVFTALFFAVPLPSGLFLGAFTLWANYVSDKYLLMHKWKKMPPIGAGLGRLCRIMFMFILFIHCLMSLHFFANWPYRGVCGGDKAKVPNCHLVCDVHGAMTGSQKNVVYVYNIFSVAGFVIMVLWMLKLLLIKLLTRYGGCVSSDLKLVTSMHARKTSEVTLRSIGNARAYVPTLTRKQLHQRLICSDLSHVPAPYNYTLRDEQAEGVEAVQFAPLSVAKLALSPGVLERVLEICGKVSFFESPPELHRHDAPPLAVSDVEMKNF